MSNTKPTENIAGMTANFENGGLAQGKVGDYYFHIHHGVLVERLTEPLENRIAYIKANKPANEIATRLRLIRPAVGVEQIFKAYDEVMVPAWKTYSEAKASAGKTYYEVRASAWKTYDEATASAWKTFNEAVASAEKTYDAAVAPARKAFNEAVEALHAEQCPNCPWNGETIFP